jgi:hypothetical protein
MISLGLGEAQKIQPLKKSPLVLRLFLTSVEILAMFAVTITVRTDFQTIDGSCVRHQRHLVVRSQPASRFVAPGLSAHLLRGAKTNTQGYPGGVVNPPPYAARESR